MDRQDQIAEYQRLNAARTRVFRSPDSLEYHGNHFAFSSGYALSTAIVADSLVVWCTQTHPQLFRTLLDYAEQKTQEVIQGYPAARDKRISFEKLRQRGAFFSHLPTHAELTWVVEQGGGTLEEWRRKFKAGRVWPNVNLPKDGLTSLISFWGTRSEVEDRHIDLVVDALDLKGTLVVQFIDTADPVVYRTETPRTVKFVSKRHPEFSHAELIDIRTKFHTRPYDLTVKEWDALEEVFGLGKNPVEPRTKRGLGAVFNWFRGKR